MRWATFLGYNTQTLILSWDISLQEQIISFTTKK